MFAVLAMWPGGAAADPDPGLSYTPAQVVQGVRAYAAHCADCHGGQLQGGVGPALAGPDFYSRDMDMPVGAAFEYMVREMPVGRPGSLAREEFAALMALVLERNGYPQGDAALDYDTALRTDAPLYFRDP